MNPDDFLEWLGQELASMVTVPIEDQERFQACELILKRSIEKFKTMSSEEKAKIYANLLGHQESIGGFQIPYDIRDEYDFIEGVIATIQWFLE